jgi:hypothetical protein
MSLRLLFVSIVLACLAAACGGDAPPPAGAAPRLLASAVAGAPLAFPGPRADYAIAPAPGGYTVTELASGAGTAVPANARLRFADISVALDLEGSAGQAYRLYRAAFDRAPDPPGIGYWMGALDQGLELWKIAGSFMASAEFAARYGAGLADVDFVRQLYRNVLHREGEAGGIAYWTGVLQGGLVTRAQVLAAFSESPEGRAAVRDAIAAGVAFTEAGVHYLPRADPGLARILDLGRRATLDGSASTVSGGRPISYAWTLARAPAGSRAVLDGADSARPSFMPDVEGDYEVRLVVSDGIAASRAASVPLTALWRPADGLVPATGNAVYLESEPGDPVGNGASYAYTQANALLGVSAQGAQLDVSVQGNQAWWGSLALPGGLARLAPGYYGGMHSEVWSGNGGLAWWGAASCDNLATTWLVIDSVTYDGDTLAAIDLRFSQRCQNGGGALHGRVRWSIDDTTQPPGPVNPPPPGLWRAPAGTTPASGNYVYLASGVGDYIGQGQARTYTGAALAVGADGAHIGIEILADTWWVGNFTGMSSLSRVTPGYYGSLQGYPFNNPTMGGLDWSGDGRSCAATGWFVVDNATYAGDALVGLDLRFEQHCGDATSAALNGQVHWLAAAQ